MYHEYPNYWKRLLTEGLSEDGAPWDWTTLGTVTPGSKIKARVFAKSSGIWAANDLTRAIVELSPDVKVKRNFKDGHPFRSGDLVVELAGDASKLFAYERPFLNLAAYVCGVASMTSRFVSQVKRACPLETPRIALTRKTLPGLRDVAIHGVRVGGGFPHRVNLAGGVLIKENHIVAAGGISKAVSRVRATAPHGLKIEIEVQSLHELEQALKAEADGVLLDNFSPAEVKAALELLRRPRLRPFVEVSGGLNEATLSDYALPGVHVLSLGALTHSVIASDLSWLVKKLK